jgi:hypothetical protein
MVAPEAADIGVALLVVIARLTRWAAAVAVPAISIRI